MSLILPVAGAYVGAFASADVGILNDDGFLLSFVPKGQDIDDTDQWGMTLIEGIYRGQDWRLRWRTKEWQAGMLSVLLGLGTTGGTAPSPMVGTIATRYTASSGSMVLTSTTGTPAASSPATLTAGQALLSPNGNYDMNFTSKVREVPIEQILLPYASGGNTVPFTTT